GLEVRAPVHACLAPMPSEFLSATNTAANRREVDAISRRCWNRLAHQDINSRLLKRSAKIGEKVALQLRRRIANGSFQPAKPKVLRIEHAARQIKAIGVTVSCVFFNLRAAWITEPKHLRDLIERFARSIID